MTEATASLNIVLFEPEIPQNTGNIARTCACVGAALHLVEPMGFRLTERNLGRAGLDYWDEVEITRYSCTDEFLAQHQGDHLFFFTGQATRSFAEVTYPTPPEEPTYLIFGRESRGIDEIILSAYPEACVRIPMRDGLRSLNLSNAVAIAAYEVLRSWNYPNLV